MKRGGIPPPSPCWIGLMVEFWYCYIIVVTHGVGGGVVARVKMKREGGRVEEKGEGGRVKKLYFLRLLTAHGCTVVMQSNLVFKIHIFSFKNTFLFFLK